MYYVDDSGAAESGWIVYAWIECAVTDWTSALRCWLDLRKRLYEEHRIPPSYELHAAVFAGGRGLPSIDPAWNARKINRAVVMQEVLNAIGSNESIRVGVVHRVTHRRGTAYGVEVGKVYEALVTRVNERSAAAAELAMIYVDGDGTAPAYYEAHRGLTLADRRVIEDPLFQTSARSQWIQMADVVAWTAYQALVRTPNRTFAWEWYDRFLLSRDVHGGPVAV
jgi:hypothetical protein